MSPILLPSHATMNLVSLEIGLAAIWESCIQAFEAVSLTRQYGVDCEVLSVKLEVERVRLLVWGNTIGLNDVANKAEFRLKRVEVHSTILRLLGSIQLIFKDSERLHNTYGLRLSQAESEDVGFTSTRQSSQSRLILGNVFKRSSGDLQRLGLEKERNTCDIRKSKWEIYDRKKFMTLAAELRKFNDNLESLFPDLKPRMMEELYMDIDESEQVTDLQLLRGATVGEPGLEDISERARVRLEALGATEPVRTEFQLNSRDPKDGKKDVGVQCEP